MPLRLIRIPKCRQRIATVIVVLVGILVGIVGPAALATSNNPIDGCYDMTNGILRIAAPDDCRRNEVALSWPSMDDLHAMQAALASETAARETADLALETRLGELEAALEAEIIALQTAAEQRYLDLEAHIRNTLASANAYTDAKFAEAMGHTDSRIENEASERAVAIGSVWNIVTEILVDIIPGLERWIGLVDTMLNNVQTWIDDQLSGLMDIISGIQDMLSGIWCFLFGC
jgi:hypothetical protein